MSRGLPQRPFPIFVSGGIDTKVDPHLVPAGSLVEVENMFFLKTGQLQLRNGFAALPATTLPTGGLDSLFTDAQGNLMAVARNWNALGQVPVKYEPAAAAAGGWGPLAASIPATARGQYPTASVTIRGVEASIENATFNGAPDLIDSDMAIANDVSLIAWRQGTGARYVIRRLSGSQPVNMGGGAGAFIGTNAPPVVAAGGSSYLCAFWVAGNALVMFSWTSAGVEIGTGTPVAAGLPPTATAWIDAKPVPGSNNIAVAYRLNAGGVACVIIDPSTLAVVVGPVATAGADINMALGFLDDANATGSLYLATAGTTAGIVLRTMSATTLAVTATTVVDASVVVGVRQITGHINSVGPLNYDVLWDVGSGAGTYFSKIQRTGVSNSLTMPSFSLASRTFKASDGQYHVIGAYESTTQPTFAVLQASSAPSPGQPNARAILMPGYAGGARSGQSHLPNVTLVGAANYVALPKRQKTVNASGVITSLRAITEAAISFSTANLRRPRELGGTLFMPGGIVMRDDGSRTSWATSPFYPESPTGASSAGGGLTASGAYSYVAVWKRSDAKGRVTRSAGSVPFAITLGAGDGTATIAVQNPRLPLPSLSGPGELWQVELYRAGPAASGATQYNKVAEQTATVAGDTVTFVDVMTDATAASGELLASTGGLLESFVTPSCSLLEVNGNRVGIVNGEDPTEFWPSLEYKAGQGLRFNPLLAIPVTGDNRGAITALAAMDGRWILFKSAAIYVISGDGPNDTGQGTFSRPQAVSLSIGTVIPGSVVATPDGIMFQGAAGIYLLDRGLGLSYIGAPVEQYTLAAPVVDASLVNGVTQVRFVQASGRCLVWDYQQKKWTTFKLRVDTNGVASTIVACTDLPSGWCYALADGSVLQETPGVFQDVSVTTTQIGNPRIGFPALALAGVNGFQRLYSVEILGEWVGVHTLAVDVEYDYTGVVAETHTKFLNGGGLAYQYEMKVAQQKASAVKLTLYTSFLPAGSGAFKLSAITLWAGMKVGGGIPYTKRLV